MKQISLKNLSYEMNLEISLLLKYFSNIGIIKNQNDAVNTYEKKLLLYYLSSKNELFLNSMNASHEALDKIKNNNVHSKKSFIPKVSNIIKDNINLNCVVKNNNIQNHHSTNNISNHTIEKIISNDNDNVQNINVANLKNKKKSNNSSMKILKSVNQEKVINIKNMTQNKNKTNNLDKKIKFISKNSSITNNVILDKNLKKILNTSELKDMNHIVNYNHGTYKEKNKHKKTKNIIKNIDLNHKNHVKNINLKNKKKMKQKNRGLLHQDFIQPNKNIIKNITIRGKISILELANKMAIKGSDFIQIIMKMGNSFTLDQIIDQETAQLIIEELGHKAILYRENILEKSIYKENKETNQNYEKKIRPPIVTVMGHVDHGKTSLLDYIRSSKVAQNESGGITQHIGAYLVKTKNGNIITFLDTPGHAAFTAMRAKGAQITDIVVLVVAGDDGVKPQTIEAIQHAKDAHVPLIVAINKLDKPEFNSEKVRKELMKHDVLSEDWGGTTIFVNVSAITGEGIDDLLNSISLQAEILELFSISSGRANGVVIEASLDKKRGSVATVLIKEGELKKGDNIFCDIHYGRVRAIRNSFGIEVDHVKPSIPVEILGLSGTPSSGDAFYVVKNEQKAREVASYKKNHLQNHKNENIKKINLEDMFDSLNNKDHIKLNIILKTDVKGSLEAISYAIQNLSNNHVTLNIISSNVGDITETDVTFAIASKAIIIGFNTASNTLANRIIKLENVDVRYYSVIYSLISDIKLLISGMVAPKYKTRIVGSAEIRDIFKPTKLVFVAGCMVINGIIKRKNHIQILRNDSIIYKGAIESLRRFKDDANEVSMGKECGIGIKNYHNICVGDIIESFEMIEIKS
ncbi:translation initiation factor IF-2 [Buchnera aphidicola]|uniref:translation initiation factor IF-2 n=1 Tax=Buchnera aphidicola TaxID=9 RepID=UPI003464237E